MPKGKPEDPKRRYERRLESSGGTRGFEFPVQGASYSKVPVVPGPYKLFFVCRVYIQGRDINTIEIQIIKYRETTQRTGF